MKAVFVYSILVFLGAPFISQAQPAKTDEAGLAERSYLIKVMTRIADPVLNALSKDELKVLMPLEEKEADRKNYTHLEAFGRLLAGMAPWLELGADPTPEGKVRRKYIDLARIAIHNACDPLSPDFMNFTNGSQPLVDAAFLAQALLRAPQQLWEPLDVQTKANIITALKSTRVITPGYNNWLLFSAIIEAALIKFGDHGDHMRMDYAIRQYQLWYKGDGAYGDGPSFHWDYYNSFVVQPMLLEVLQVLANKDENLKSSYDLALERAQRYAAVQERLISPEGTYPPIGRSLAYRFGVFQLLSKMAQLKALPNGIKPQQVRAALYTVIKKQIEAPGTFDDKGWLRIGFYGHQPEIGEGYISTGSLYLCAEAFLVLGLPASDDFWQGPDADWSAKKIWKGEDVNADHAID
ncbi:MAG: DUF2264 domain-containing protein [Chitinophagales bacterium]